MICGIYFAILAPTEASFVVTRAGGTSLAEIACIGLPMVIIPYPRSLRNHQLINAKNIVARQGGFLVEQEPASSLDAELSQALTILISDVERRKRISKSVKQLARPNAAQQVCDVILETLQS